MSLSHTQFTKGPRFGLTAEITSKIAQKYDIQKEEELRVWIESMTGMALGDNFQKSLQNGIILCELINKLQPGSVRKINQSKLNWHQLENLTNFIKAIQHYGIKPYDIFEANDLFDNANMTQVQTTLLAVASMAKTKGVDTGVSIGVKYADKQQRSFDEETLRAGSTIIGLQMGTNRCASQSGMIPYGAKRNLYDQKLNIGVPLDSSTIGLQMGSNKGASQTGMCAPGTRRGVYDKKLCLESCDHTTASLQMGTNKGANQSGLNIGLGRQVYDPKYCPQSTLPADNHSPTVTTGQHSPEGPGQHPTEDSEEYD
ncbi:calponin-1 [Callorhinchus milii]|uniref:calponin-1 n=1 Tax=Callorhinchus milii TaxID=7868 RepID=UPI001C3FB04D|nr:calponin-1 [Callorhinchus milii]